MADAQTAYPAHWEADVVLRDGGVVHVRPIRPEDAEAVHVFHAGQSAESIYLRFFAPLPRLSDREVARFTQVDYVDRVGLVATLGDAIVGIARYDRIEDGRAEVAFNISDAHQGRGIGTVLLEHLLAAARERGITKFVAEVLPQNRKMMGVFTEAGYEVSHHYEDGVIALSFDISPTEHSDEVRESREHRSESRSMQTLLTPRSVVVVGASRDPDSIGHRLLENVVAGRFTGQLYVVNPEAAEVLGVPSYSRVDEVPPPIDLAVVAVPADAVNEVVRDCARAGVRGLVVVSSGFAETGDAGRARQETLVRLARAHGMRVVGPNSFGMVNNDPQVRLNASLAPQLPPPGRLGLFSQSGALGIAVLASSARRGLGVSTFVSSGNRADVSGNDAMQYWIDDPATDAVGLYLESMGNPRKFSRIARRLSRVKPVIVVKSGLSTFGVPPGHTVRPTRMPREALDEMLQQAGVIRVENVHQMFDVAQLVVHQPLPAGPRVAVVTNSTALGSLAAEACQSWGLDVQHGPVNVASEATAEEFRRALTAAFGDEDVDSVVVCFIPPLVTLDEAVVRALTEVASSSDKTCVATFLGMRGVTNALSPTPAEARDDGPEQDDGREHVDGEHGERAADVADDRSVPAYPTPEDSVRALAAATRYAQWRRRDRGARVTPTGINHERAHHLVERLVPVDPDGVWLGDDDAAELLAAYGITLWPAYAVDDPDSALEAAHRLGYPVALKATAEHLRHRADLGGVRLDIAGDAELLDDLTDMRSRLGGAGGGAQLVVQAMAPVGVACVVRSTEDPLFGPVVEFGVGGPPTELLGDVARRIPPLREGDVADLVRSIRAAPLLFGHRGTQPVDTDALEDVLSRVSVLADELPEVAELELNPVVVAARGAAVLSAGIMLARPVVRADSDRRRLPG
ncbi:MAG TPA: bifunctional GNAT family N-acetyltransferase/acetate--CoA ligase family protein [Actinomycetales bacterium]|nr:bifunctional GNAT family N-acetyltransferase/acetate--CoA ligase family protein [Actinomycetales bacterium]